MKQFKYVFLNLKDNTFFFANKKPKDMFVKNGYFSHGTHYQYDLQSYFYLSV